MRYENLKTKVERAGLRMNPPASAEEVTDFELIAGIRLPEDYARFLTEVGNGGGLTLRLVPLQYWDIRFGSLAKLESDLRKPCVITPLAENLGAKWLDELAIENLAEKWDAGEWDPLYGTIAIAEIGCGLFFFLVVNGDYVGRVFSWGDHPLNPPLFAPEATFAEWVESYFDERIAAKGRPPRWPR